jgi:hypothetical protein
MMNIVVLGILSTAIDFRPVGSQSQAWHLQISAIIMRIGLFSISPDSSNTPLEMPIVRSV